MTGTALAILAALLLAIHLASIGLYLYRLRRPTRPAGLIGQPFVTLLRPVCGLDPFDAETLRSSFHLDYPGYEVIFCVDSADDPVVRLVNRLIAEYPRVPARLLIGRDTVSGNPKLNNLVKGWHAARADWVCMADSNLLLPRDYLTRIVAAWGPKTGLVSSPPIGIRPQGFGGHLECAILNSNQARLQAAVDTLGFGFAQGKTLFWNKALLNRAGGIAALGRHLAEDVTATRIIRRFGLQITLIVPPFAQPIGHRTPRQVWDRHLRWSRVRRDGFSLLFLAEVFNGAVVPALACAGAVAMSGAPPLWLPAYLALWYVAEAALMRFAKWPSGLADIALLPLRDLMLVAIWITTFAGRGFEWRGTAMAPDKPPVIEPAE